MEKRQLGTSQIQDYPDNYGDLASWEADVGGN
jgi:hypothetical protein